MIRAIGPTLEPHERRLFRQATSWWRPRKIRTLAEFLEEEIVIPDGPHKGLPYSLDTQPWSRHWCHEIDSRRWRRHAAVGPTQSGKTLTCALGPMLWHLFEYEESVCFGVPTGEMAGDKWREDIRPVIEASPKLRRMLPTSGTGSRGAGKVEAIKFQNGATLKFITGGGSDKKRAGFTARVLVVTEVDGMDEAGGESYEADKVSQMEGRVRAWGEDARIYLECTASHDKGRIWREYKNGSESRICLPCPYCSHYVTPEREHFVDHDHETKLAAAKHAHFVCPNCGQDWSEADRFEANREAVLLHAGQSIDQEGKITGEIKETDTLGFRWSAVNNLFAKDGAIAMDEWEARASTDPENQERKARQQVWAVPIEPDAEPDVELSIRELLRRIDPVRPRGFAPKDTAMITIGGDVGKRLLHWSCNAYLADGSKANVDYGVIEAPTDNLGFEQGMFVAGEEWHDLVAKTAWPRFGGGDPISARQGWIDGNYAYDQIYALICRHPQGLIHRTLGRGAKQQASGGRKVTAHGGKVVGRGPGYRFIRQKGELVPYVEVDADVWKTRVHRCWKTPVEDETHGWSTLWHVLRETEHLAFCKHLLAERAEPIFIPGKGVVFRWNQIAKNNHWLDCEALSLAAAHFAGIRGPQDHAPATARPAAPVQAGQRTIYSHLLER